MKVKTPSIIKPKNVLILGSGPAGKVCLSSLDDLGISCQIADDIPAEILRVGGHFLIQNETNNDLPDLLALTPLDAEEQERLFDVLKMPDGRTLFPLNSDQINSLDFGIVICPPDIDPGISGMAAAARINAWLSGLNRRKPELAAEVDSSRCRACGTCVEVCGFGIPEIVKSNSGWISRIDPWLCLGCGICAAQCPSGAIHPGITTENQLEEMLDLILT